MTVIANVKGTVAQLKSIQAELSHFAQVSSKEEAQEIFHECMLTVEEVIEDIEKRVEYMKAEELQYRQS